MTLIHCIPITFKNLYCTALLLCGLLSYAQIDEEVANTVRKPTVNVKSIEKKEASPVLPQIAEQNKQNVEYQLLDIPAESNFQPSPLPPSKIKNLPQEKRYENYIEGAYGNLTHLWLDAYGQYALDDSKTIGLRLNHNSTAKLKDYPYNVATDFGLTKVEGFFKDELKSGNLLANLNYSNQRLNLFGSSMPERYFPEDTEIEVAQCYSKIGTELAYTTFTNKFFNHASFQANYLTDLMDSRELDFRASATLDKTGYIATIFNNDFDLGGEIPIGISYTSTQFDQELAHEFGYFNAQLSPTAKLLGEQFDFKLGATVSFLSESKSSESDFYFFPKVRIDYKGLEVFQVFAGVDGGLQINNYKSLIEEVPYLFPDLVLLPTENKYRAFGGIKGQINENFSYIAEGSFANADQILMYQKRRDELTEEGKAFNKFNTLEAIYDNGNIFQIRGSLQYLQIENLNLGLEATYTGYDLENYKNVLNRPNLEAKIKGSYAFWDNKLSLGAQLFFVGERKTNDFTYIDEFTLPTESIVSLDSYFDANFTADYQIRSNLNVFARLLNVFNAENELFAHYPMQGFQVSGGLLFKF